MAPCATSLTIALAVWMTGVRGADYPAHELRAVLWDRAGAAVWNFAWYTGHPTLTYGPLSPPLVAAFGTFPVAVCCSVIATGAFAMLVDRAPFVRPTIAAHAFAVTVSVNVFVGRVAFSVGLALALVMLVALRADRRRSAAGLAGLTALASPVAAAFVVLAMTTVVVHRLGDHVVRRVERRRCIWTAVLVGMAAAGPVVVSAWWFGTEGRFPFRAGHFAVAVAVAGSLIALVRHRLIRVGAGLSITAMVVVFAVPNALGGNVVRLVQIVVVPLVVAATPGVAASAGRRLGIGLVVVGASMWSLSPAVVAAVDWVDDPSVDTRFYDSLLQEVRARNTDGRPVGRLEIPFTLNHWESAWVAPEVPYARGWERQIDLGRNAVLYDPDLTTATYQDWVRRNAVRWIAVPDVPLDPGGAIEAAVVESASREIAPWVHLVWRDDRWRLYEVVDHEPIVEPPATLVAYRSDEIVIRSARAVRVTVRVTGSPRLAIEPDGCLTAGPDGSIVAVLPDAGTYRITGRIISPTDEPCR